MTQRRKGGLGAKSTVELSPLPLLLLHHGHPRAEQAAGGRSARVHQGAEGEASTPPNRTHPPLPPTPPQRQPIRFNVRPSACTRASRQCSKHLPRGVGLLRAGSDGRCITHTHTHTHLPLLASDKANLPLGDTLFPWPRSSPLTTALSLGSKREAFPPRLNRTHTFPPHTSHCSHVSCPPPLSLPLPRERTKVRSHVSPSHV